MAYNDRKQIFSFTANPELIDEAKIVATVLDMNFSQFICEAIQEKIDASGISDNKLVHSID
jgi:hypothetical protein